MLDVKNLNKTFKNSGNLVNALSNISLPFESSKIYGIIGPNGAGKTTLIKAICGLIYPDSGNVYISGKKLYPNNFSLLSQIGAILEGSRNIFWNFTPLQNVKYFSLLKGIDSKAALNRAMELFSLFNIEEKINSPVRHLSQGMKQKIAIIISTLHDPSILLLDEPTLGLDPISSQHMQSIIKDLAYNQKKVVILTSHHLHIIEKNCDYLVFLKDGKVLSYDTVDNIKRSFSKKIYIFLVKDGDNIKTLEKSLSREEFYPFLISIQKEGLEILDIETREPSLEDIFMKEARYNDHKKIGM